MSKKPRISYRDLGRLTPEAETPETASPAPAKPRATVARHKPVEPVENSAAPSAAPAAPPVAAAAPAPATAAAPAVVLPPSAVPQVEVSQLEVSPSAVSPVAFRFRDRAKERVGTAELLLFRVGPELFGLPLSAVEEAIDCPPPHPLPEMPRAMHGVFPLRESLVALFGADLLLGVHADAAETALVFRGRGRRLAIAVDDVDDVFTADLTLLRDAPGADAGDGILLGVVRRGADLIGVLDPEALLAACRSDTVLEAAA